jgi:hypothetical protein
MDQSSSWEASRSSASRRISLIPRLMYPFRNMFKFLRWGAVNTSPNAQPGGPPLVGCPRLFTQYIPSDRPYLEAVPPTATWRRAMPWWQGPTYRHVIFVTYIFIFCRQRTFTRRTGGHCLDLWSTPSSRHYCIRILRVLFPVTTPVTWRLCVVTDIHKTTFREPADLLRIPRLMSFPWLLRDTYIWNWCSRKLAWCLIPVVFKGRLESYIYIWICCWRTWLPRNNWRAVKKSPAIYETRRPCHLILFCASWIQSTPLRWSINIRCGIVIILASAARLMFSGFLTNNFYPFVIFLVSVGIMFLGKGWTKADPLGSSDLHIRRTQQRILR